MLYSFRRCPYAMRARMALRVAGMPLEIREVLLTSKPAALRAASAKATVPVLVLPDGRVLEESLDIMRWALAQHDSEGWLRPGAAASAGPLIARNDGPFKALLDAYKYPERHPEASQHAYRAQAVDLQIAPLEAMLAARPWLLTDAATLADIALFPFVRQFVQVDPVWFAQAGFARLHAWMQRIATGPLFESVMLKLPPWTEGDDATRF